MFKINNRLLWALLFLVYSLASSSYGDVKNKDSMFFEGEADSANFLPTPPSLSLKPKKEVRVSIPIAITTFKKAKGAKEGFLPAETTLYMLKAMRDKDNHFLIDDYHFETTALAQENDFYQFKLSIMQQFSKGAKLEEELGSLHVSGLLVPGKDKNLSFKGYKTLLIKDKFMRPQLQIEVGEKHEDDRMAKG
jgi:hypothetical protein